MPGLVPPTYWDPAIPFSPRSAGIPHFNPKSEAHSFVRIIVIVLTTAYLSHSLWRPLSRSHQHGAAVEMKQLSH